MENSNDSRWAIAKNLLTIEMEYRNHIEEILPDGKKGKWTISYLCDFLDSKLNNEQNPNKEYQNYSDNFKKMFYTSFIPTYRVKKRNDIIELIDGDDELKIPLKEMIPLYAKNKEKLDAASTKEEKLIKYNQYIREPALNHDRTFYFEDEDLRDVVFYCKVFEKFSKETVTDWWTYFCISSEEAKDLHKKINNKSISIALESVSWETLEEKNILSDCLQILKLRKKLKSPKVEVKFDPETRKKLQDEMFSYYDSFLFLAIKYHFSSEKDKQKLFDITLKSFFLKKPVTITIKEIKLKYFLDPEIDLNNIDPEKAYKKKKILFGGR